MDQREFKSETSDTCLKFEPKNGRELIINVNDKLIYEHYRSKPCYKGNSYADYCDYCARDICLYYKPEVNMVPVGQEKTVILNSEEAALYRKNKRLN